MPAAPLVAGNRQRRRDAVARDASAIEPAPAGIGPETSPCVGSTVRSGAWISSSGMPARRPDSATAPTAATSSRNDASSNAQQEAVQQQVADLTRRAVRDGDVGAVRVERLQPGPEDRDRELDEDGDAEHDRDRPLARGGAPQRPGASPPPTYATTKT